MNVIFLILKNFFIIISTVDKNSDSVGTDRVKKVTNSYKYYQYYRE